MLTVFSLAAAQHKRKTDYQVWTHENHAVILYSNDFTTEKIDYIHHNTVRALLVQNSDDYLYSCARNYAGLCIKWFLRADLRI
ncbi:MAG: hypothetical protein JXR39_03140 [Marinilabiliaceae bacterium]|nr:hypothetical protein [Marinilabiliaceae bacterium]